MSQCVPSWDLDDGPVLSKPSLRSHSNSDVPMIDYEVAELTWENGQLALHGLGPPRGFPHSKLAPTTAPAPTNNANAGPTWPDKPRATAGTLESLVNQATTRFTHPASAPRRGPHPGPEDAAEDDELVPWFDDCRRTPGAATLAMDAMVPCSNRAVGCSTRVGSCSGRERDNNDGAKRARARGDWGGGQSASGSATFGRDTDRESHHVALDTCERRGGIGFTSTSFGGSPSQTQDNTSYGRPTCTTGKTVTADENDSVGHSRPSGEAGDDEEEEEEQQKKGNGKSSGSTKRSRAAAIHNQSERKRRDKINQRMKTLQKLVPNSSKTDKASMLDEVIDYLKQLQAQVQMMGRMNMQTMMMPMAMQQQLQMSMMAPMTMGMGMGMGMGVMDMSSMGRPNMAGLSPVIHPSVFMPLASWDGSGGNDWLSAASAAMMPDPMSAFLASQPMTMEAYSRMAAFYQQLNQQPPASSSKN